ncbi:MAG: YD repeat-containing protein [Aquabacterium sp.]
MNHKTGELSAVGTLKTYVYDAAGNLLKQRVYGDAITPLPRHRRPLPNPVNVANYRETLYVYDANSRQTSQTINGNNQLLVGEISPVTGNYEVRTQDLNTSKTLDANGNVVSETDARGNTTWRYYDKAGNQIAQVDAERYLTVWSYDAGGHVKLQTQYANKLADGVVLKKEDSVVDPGHGCASQRATARRL